MVKVITYLIENDSTVQSLLGEKSHGENHKVYPVFVPQGEKAPFITVRLNDSPRLGHNLSCGRDYVVMVSVWSNNYDDLDALCDAVIDAVDGRSGTINGEEVNMISYENQADLDYDKDHSVVGRGTTFRFIA